MQKKITFSNLKNPGIFLATGFGSGLSPVAPGTMGTIIAIPIWYFLQFMPLAVYAAVIVILFGVGVWVSKVTTEVIGEQDHPSIVIDEIVGLLITLFGSPLNIIWVITGFCLFRLFDILKPWPISWCDKNIKGGFGIMVDDVVAGLFSFITLQLLIYYFVLL